MAAPDEELPELLVAANIGTTVALVPFVLRLRIAWGFVSSRLKARTTYYEANQRGYEAKKDKGDLLRDRLVEETQVRPILERVDRSRLAPKIDHRSSNESTKPARIGRGGETRV